MRVRTTVCASLLALLTPAAALAQSQIPARVMVLIDTSGSMGFYFADPANFGNPGPNTDYPGGDGSTSYSDKNLTNASMFPGKLVGGAREGVKSRLYASKFAFNQAINAYAGDIDFGLMTYDFQLCGYNQPLCNDCTIQCDIFGNCGFNCLYTDNAFKKLVSTNWIGSGCDVGSVGGRVIELPTTGSNKKILPWVDGVEVHKAGSGAWPQNPEIRADGPTPLAQAIKAAKSQWYDVVKSTDPQVDCRPYGLVVLTDGAQSTGTCDDDPVAAVSTVHGASNKNPVSVYVIAVSIGQAQDKKTMNDMAKAGGTGNARFADKQQDIEAAFADIASSTVKFEVCNGQDDTCNGLIDEGLGVYQECTANGQCKSGVCSSGRCTCANDAQCDAGNLCSAGLCVPGCSAGVGACQRVGVMKCSSSGSVACCADDDKAACTALVAGTPTTEVCNGKDDDCDGLIDEDGVCQKCIPVPEVCDGKDNDCDGVADNNLTDINKPCGLQFGICTKGTTACVGGALVCQGGVQPKAETCNGLDDNCDGTVDGMTRTCYSGPAATKDVGVCVEGQQKCNAAAGSGKESWTPCVGEITPKTEVCDGLDNDCNGKVDDIPGLGGDCCPYKDSAGKDQCNVGICKSGKLQCVPGVLQPQCVGAEGPQPETCDGKDNDCNGKVDDISAGGGPIGSPCCTSDLCGKGECKQGAWGCTDAGLTCIGEVTPKSELCDGKDNDCNGKVDDIPGLGEECCDSGKCGKGICVAGTLVCNGAELKCDGEITPQTETCNNQDDDCNGAVDDVPGLGEPCCPEGTPGDAPQACNKGICKPGITKCDGPTVACIGAVGPQPEVCDGEDNDCDGQIDEADDVAKNDPTIGQPCDAPASVTPPCKAGSTVCKAGKAACEGAVKPGTETCDGIDNDCDGSVDEGDLCSSPKKCIGGSCVAPCGGGEFQCPGGYECKDGYCIPPKTGQGGASGSGGSGGSGGKGGSSAGGSSQGGSSQGGSGGSSGGSQTEGGSGGSSGGGQAGGQAGASAGSAQAGQTSMGGAGAGAAPATNAEPEDSGGCGCQIPGQSGQPWGAFATLALLTAVVRRRRGGAR